LGLNHVGGRILDVFLIFFGRRRSSKVLVSHQVYSFW
jgi:hypothetical protein